MTTLEIVFVLVVIVLIVTVIALVLLLREASQVIVGFINGIAGGPIIGEKKKQ